MQRCQDSGDGGRNGRGRRTGSGSRMRRRGRGSAGRRRTAHLDFQNILPNFGCAHIPAIGLPGARRKIDAVQPDLGVIANRPIFARRRAEIRGRLARRWNGDLLPRALRSLGQRRQGQQEGANSYTHTVIVYIATLRLTKAAFSDRMARMRFRLNWLVLLLALSLLAFGQASDMLNKMRVEAMEHSQVDR